MTSLSSDLRTLLDSSVEQRNAAPGALRMLDGATGLVKPKFESGSGRHGSAWLDRWPAIIRLQPAAGIVNGARVRVSVGWWRRLIRLRMTIDTDIWGLSGRPAMPDRRIWEPVPQLTITASGIPRPLRLMTVSRWL